MILSDGGSVLLASQSLLCCHRFFTNHCHCHVSNGIEGSGHKINGLSRATPSVQISGAWWGRKTGGGEDLRNGWREGGRGGKGSRFYGQAGSGEVGWACWFVLGKEHAEIERKRDTGTSMIPELWCQHKTELTPTADLKCKFRSTKANKEVFQRFHICFQYLLLAV